MRDTIHGLRSMGTTLTKQAANQLEYALREVAQLRTERDGLTAMSVDLRADVETLTARVATLTKERDEAGFTNVKLTVERDTARAELEALRADMLAGLKEMSATIDADLGANATEAA